MSTLDVCLVHLSVKEYLVLERIRSSPTLWCSFNKKLANIFIAQTCLAYLLQFVEHDFTNSGTASTFPLSGYAAKYWMHHAWSDDDGSSDALQNMIMELFCAEAAPFTNWLKLYDLDEYPTLTIHLADTPRPCLKGIILFGNPSKPLETP